METQAPIGASAVLEKFIVTSREPADLLREADRAAAAGDAVGARRALEALVATAPDTSASWLKLAAMCRATGDDPASLRAIERALALTPLDFGALLMRASLLERTGSPEADEGYVRALAQRPSGAVPPALATIVAHAEKRAIVATAEREARLDDACEGIAVSEDEAGRLTRYRSNILRRTRPYHCEPTHYHYPGLREREFHDRADFPWLPRLEAATATIRAEFERCVAADRAELVPYIQYREHEPLAQWRSLNHSRDWTAIHLLQNGKRIEQNVQHCPAAMALLDEIGQPDVPHCSPNAMFSLLAPGTSIPPHTGIANTRLVCHLPLVVPEGCWFRVGAQTRKWAVGEGFVFDDTIEHEAANPSGQLRVVFIFDLWHPDLSAAERAAVGAMMSADVGGAEHSL